MEILIKSNSHGYPVWCCGKESWGIHHVARNKCDYWYKDWLQG